jgi:peroxiredoxin
MVMTESTMLPLGSKAPNFSLPDAQGKRYSLGDFQDAPGLLVVFMCNHCPFVVHIAEGLAAFAKEYQARDLAIVGINSNDVKVYPEDSPAKMLQYSKANGYTFPYLYDENQSIAKAYQAACTPDFFLFDADQKLAYRGQFDSSRPGNSIPVTGENLRRAADAVLSGDPVFEDQKPSIGCNIKWRQGKEPDYFSA